MEGTPAIYQGRLVSKENFRAFIYAPGGHQRLVESWDEFEASMQSGLWFATREEVAEASKPKPKPRVRKPVPLPVIEDTPEPEVDDMAFEVKDDFLPRD